MASVLPIASDAMLPMPLVIEKVDAETHDTFTMHLTPPEGGMAFAPGQFNMLYVFGVGEVPISISGDPAHPERLVHTIRSVGSVTRELRALQPGDSVGVRGPFGTSWPLDEAKGKDLILVAGGIGLAPLRPAIYQALARRDEFERVYLFYGTRTSRDILYDDELMTWRGRFDLEVEVTVDRGVGGWRGKTGVVTKLLERGDFDPDRTVAMMCGPEIMMRFSARELQNQGVPLERIWVTVERNMQCAIAQCGHCQWGPELICRDGPVYRIDKVARLFGIREV